MLRITKTLLIAVLLMAAGVSAGEIHQAASTGDLEAVRTLLDNHPDFLNAPDDAGALPIHAAARAGHLEIVKLLLDRGVEVDVPDREATTPLGVACLGGQLEVARLLIDKGANVMAVDQGGLTPLLWAVQGRNAELVAILLEKGASLQDVNGRGSNVLHLACFAGDQAMAELLLARGMEINGANSGGYTPVLLACLSGNVDLVRALMERGADITRRSSQDETAMHLAARRGNIEMVDLLLNLGLDVNVTCEGSITPMAYATQGQPEMIRWLLAHGASPDPINDSAVAPLMWATYAGDTTVIRALIEGGAKVDCRHVGGDTPLQSVVNSGNLELARILLQAGAEPNLVEHRCGKTPLHMAALLGQTAMAELLISHGAELDPVDNLNKTPLQYAAQYAHRPVVTFLEESGANTSGVVENYGPPSELTETPPEGEAVVRYLCHSGWSVRTAHHFLIFDYNEMSGRPDEPCLANGFIVPEEIKDLPVTVFSTHEHGDHYDTVIFNWREKVPDITYVLGHQPTDQTGYEHIAPRDSRMIGDIKVTTINSTDAGVGYVVEVDGLTIFHAGDHSSGTVDLPEPFRTEIAFIADNCPRPDLAFLPISGCSLGTPESVKAGAYYTIDRLKPRVVFPQHRGNSEYDLAQFEQEARERGVTTPIRAAGHRGDVFDIGPSIGI